MRLLPFLLAGFSAAATEKSEISGYQIHFRNDLFKGIRYDSLYDSSMGYVFDLSFEHVNGLMTKVEHLELKTSLYKYLAPYGCDLQSEVVSGWQTYGSAGSNQVYDSANYLYTVRVEIPEKELPPTLCIRLGLWGRDQAEWVTNKDVLMTINTNPADGEYVGTFSTDFISLDPASNLEEQSGVLTEEVEVDAFLCGIPGEEGATGLGTPSVPVGGVYKIGEEFRICVQPSEEKAMEYYVSSFNNVFCEIGTPGIANYKRTLFNDGYSTDVLTHWLSALGSASSDRTMVAGSRGLSFATTVVSAYFDSEAFVNYGDREILCEGKVGLTKSTDIQYQAEFSHLQGTSSEVFEINFLDNYNDWIGNCKKICQQKSYTHFGFECVQKDKDKINCICEVQNVDEASPPDGTYDLQKIGTPACHHPSICSDTQYIDGFFLGGVGYYAYMYPIDPEYETSPASQSSGDGPRVLQESETESEEFGFSISIRIQNEVDDLGRLQDLLAAPGADPKVWTIADLVAGFATAAAMAMAAI